MPSLEYTPALAAGSALESGRHHVAEALDQCAHLCRSEGFARGRLSEVQLDARAEVKIPILEATEGYRSLLAELVDDEIATRAAAAERKAIEATSTPVDEDEDWGYAPTPRAPSGDTPVPGRESAEGTDDATVAETAEVVPLCPVPSSVPMVTGFVSEPRDDWWRGPEG